MLEYYEHMFSMSLRHFQIGWKLCCLDFFFEKHKCDSNTLRRSVRHEPSGCWCNCDGCGCLDFKRHCIRTPHIFQQIYSIQVAIVHILKQPESSPDHQGIVCLCVAQLGFIALDSLGKR